MLKQFGISAIVGFLLVYGAFVFIAWDFNIAGWSTVTRACMVAIWYIITLFIHAMRDLNE